MPLIERCAIFEFTAEQVGNAKAYVPEADGVPPFPFPMLCLVDPTGVVMLRDPVMDEDTGVLTYQAIAGHHSGKAFQTGTCTMGPDGAVLTSGGRSIIDGRYVDADHPFAKVSPDDVPALCDRHAESVEDARSDLVIAHDLGCPRAVESAAAALKKAESFHAITRALSDQIAQADQELREVSADFGVAVLDIIGSAFEIGLQQVQWINKPDHYTIEVGPSAPPRKPKPGRVTRLAERPRHIVLTKSEIAEAWHRTHGGGSHASPMPHLRRGHYRTLRAAKYKTSRRVWVRATQVNGECVEWRDGDVRYRVV